MDPKVDLGIQLKYEKERALKVRDEKEMSYWVSKIYYVCERQRDRERERERLTVIESE